MTTDTFYYGYTVKISNFLKNESNYKNYSLFSSMVKYDWNYLEGYF